VADAGVSVLIVDDQLPFRVAARSVVRATPGFDVAGEAGSGEEAVEQAHALAPALVLMDINMAGMGGIEATRRITAGLPTTRVILLSTYDADDLPADARSCGAIAYVHKEDFGPEELIRVWPGDDATTGPGGLVSG
jgi:two-component system, NarL family, invasion response regulator UvrY